MANQLISSHPSVIMGKSMVAGTRITVELILDELASGQTNEQTLAAHPRFTEPAIHAAIEFAAQSLRADVIYPVREPVA